VKEHDPDIANRIMYLSQSQIRATIEISRGRHANRSQGVSATEIIAWMGGEPHTDRPTCLCPVIGAYLGRLADSLADGPRQQLWPVLSTLVGTGQVDAEILTRRQFRLIDHLCRFQVPMALRWIGRDVPAKAIRDEIPVTDWLSAQAMAEVIRGATNMDGMPEVKSPWDQMARNVACRALLFTLEALDWPVHNKGVRSDGLVTTGAEFAASATSYIHNCGVYATCKPGPKSTFPHERPNNDDLIELAMGGMALAKSNGATPTEIDLEKW
jgi:hypothetical protein